MVINFEEYTGMKENFSFLFFFLFLYIYNPFIQGYNITEIEENKERREENKECYDCVKRNFIK